jgi:hypothetical protein
VCVSCQSNERICVLVCVVACAQKAVDAGGGEGEAKKARVAQPIDDEVE